MQRIPKGNPATRHACRHRAPIFFLFADGFGCTRTRPRTHERAHTGGLLVAHTRAHANLSPLPLPHGRLRFHPIAQRGSILPHEKRPPHRSGLFSETSARGMHRHVYIHIPNSLRHAGPTLPSPNLLALTGTNKPPNKPTGRGWPAQHASMAGRLSMLQWLASSACFNGWPAQHASMAGWLSMLQWLAGSACFDVWLAWPANVD